MLYQLSYVGVLGLELCIKAVLASKINAEMAPACKAFQLELRPSAIVRPQRISHSPQA
ncbi:protein of unknown function [Nitrospina watsonii]|uniref:Uncharacterized protein n=1 Tax=Nitrospina watsonii TaxID=1323948 RepID=A0ABM9HAB1_9BACT|nr:protein of unknown function [Nitrospina watsonii]